MASSEKPKAEKKAKASNKSKPETPKPKRTPNRVTKPSSSGGNGIDADHIFLLTCMEAANFKPDFVSMSEEMGVRKDAVRMRFKRLADRIHAAIAAEQTPGTGQGPNIKQEDSDATKSAEESHDDETSGH